MISSDSRDFLSCDFRFRRSRKRFYMGKKKKKKKKKCCEKYKKKGKRCANCPKA
jgi:hypothetical protein